jgi:hypothetical protein
VIYPPYTTNTIHVITERFSLVFKPSLESEKDIAPKFASTAVNALVPTGEPEERSIRDVMLCSLHVQRRRPFRKWYTRDDDDVEDRYQSFVQRGIDIADGDPPKDIRKKLIRVGSHMLAEKERCNAIANRTPGPAPEDFTSEAETVAASGGRGRRLRGSQGSLWQ